MSAELAQTECKIVHTMVDKGEITFLDEAYCNLLNLIHEFINKFIKMTYDIGHAMSKSNVANLYKLIDSYNNVESYDILRRLTIENKSSVRSNHNLAERSTNFRIIFEEHESKVCCNEKCVIF